MSAKDKINQLLPRDIFDQLHKKTHFKAVQSLSLGGLHNSLRSSLNGSPQNVMPSKQNSSNSKQVAKSQNIQNENVSNLIETQQTNVRTKIDMTVPLTQDEIVKHARQVLQDCNVQPIGKSPILSKGGGRLMSNSLHTNKEVFQMTSAFKSAQQSKDNSIL